MDKITDLLVETEGGDKAEFKKMVWIKIEEAEPEACRLGEVRPTAGSIQHYVQQRGHERRPEAS